ncbi:MAG TPA: methyltransferase, TIGR04325 family [Fontimonas sp.]
MRTQATPMVTLRSWIPPALIGLARKLPGRASRYEGPFDSWGIAAQRSAGYAANGILEQVRRSTEWALGAPDRYEQDSVRFTGPCPPSHALAAVLLGLARADSNAVVLDIGGALGSHYLRWRPWMRAAGLAHWRIVEQDHFVAAGEALFEGRSEPLTFHRTLQDLPAEIPAAILLSSVLQYIPAERDPLEAICRLGAQVIVIDRTPFSESSDEQVLVQHIPPRIYQASYPLRVISHARVNALLAPAYTLLHSFDTGDGTISLRGVSATYRGQVWVRSR